ncbi:MAG: hypothetical protein GY861_21960 [bacterium]|nr:hypothetical protein [bacterium]
MVHFDFVLSDLDAQNLFDIIQSEVCRCLEKKLSLLFDIQASDKDTDSLKVEYDWYGKHIVYLTDLKSQMQNKRVKGL